MGRCALCPGKNTCVPADGPERCKFLFVGESPGKDETKYLKPFCGRTGQEVNSHYLPLAGFRRENVRFVNAIQCQPSTPDGKLHPDKAPHRALLESCAQCHLYPEIERAKPDVIITMGAFAAMALDPTINLELHHGIPRETKWGTVVPFFHPSLGLWEPKKMLAVRTDWDQLRRWLKGTWTAPIDEYTGFEDYQHLSLPSEIRDSLEGEWDKPLGADTEITYRRKPFCWSYSTRPGTGYVVRADDEDCIHAFQEELDRWQGKILFHNWLFDSDVVSAIGLNFPERLIVDTMERVYHLGNLPQGLKALALRELGMSMQDFADLVLPYSTPVALTYLRNAMAEDWPKPEEELYKDFKTGQWKVKKPQGMGTKIKRFLTAAAKKECLEVDGESTIDPFKAWDDNWTDSHEMIEAVMGPWPGMCISHVPFERTVRYAARDADTLVRLWPILEHMARRTRKFSQEKWRDAA